MVCGGPPDCPEALKWLLAVDGRCPCDQRTLRRLSNRLDERARRILAAAEAKTAGYGGIVVVARATGMAASTIRRGLKELAAAELLDLGRVRRHGGGGKKRVAQDPMLLIWRPTLGG